MSDPHSFTDRTQGEVTELDLRWTVDFDARELRGSVRLQLAEAGLGPLDLDTRGLRIAEVLDDAGSPLAWTLSEVDPVRGQRLRVLRHTPVDAITIRYATGRGASGLMWLEPAMTAGGEHPFLLSQCQAVHARSLVPLQDSPQVRVRYRAEVAIPAALSAVMSAAPGQTEVTADGTKIVRFAMPQPIPPYLLALAVGELEARDLGPRTRVYAEPDVVDAAAWEFADVERMLEAAEGLFGDYPWERYDFIVLPPSFPLGGMENPRMTFLTPTLLAGDRSLVGVLAHELAHSWTGNLVTNATNEDFWLNEGWTVYAERRILAVLYGEEAAAQDAILARRSVDAVIARKAAAGRPTALCYPQEGLDPDDEFSLIPYEKGFLLVTALERAVGRERFDAFVQDYLATFRFQSIPTATFTAFVDRQLPDHGVDLQRWIYGEGMPDEAPRFASSRLDELQDLAASWSSGARPQAPETWSTTERLYYLDILPPDADCGELDALFGFARTGNAELRSAWLQRVVSTGYPSYEQLVEDFVGVVGRTKLLTPLFRALVVRDRPLAERLYAANADRWHGSTRGTLQGVLG